MDGMQAKLLRRDKLSPLVDALIRDCEVIAPKDELSYGKLDAASQLQLSCTKPRRSLKQYFYPEREVLVNYKVGPQGVEIETPPPPELGQPRVVFGAHPCDVAAFPILDKLFTWDYLDPSYLRLREQTTIVTVACDDPPRTCFCTSVGGSPAGTEGTDVLLSPLDDAYHVQIVTDKGRALVDQYVEFFEESDEAHDQEQERLAQGWRRAIGREVDAAALKESMEFESTVWETLTQQCIDCGICTFLCPTCHCFDIQDEGTPGNGCRVRLWDACAFQAFTEAAAHQPRPKHYSRYRQRIMHKFQYYPTNFGRILCVGCGRCISYCPVSIDLRSVLDTVKE